MQHICSQWSLSPANVLVVGDDKTDVMSGRAAGTGKMYKTYSTDTLGLQWCHRSRP